MVLRKNPRKQRGWRRRFNFSVIARQVWRVPDSTLSTRRPLHSLALDRRNRHSAELRFSCGVSPRIPRPRRSGSSFCSRYLHESAISRERRIARMEDRFRSIFISFGKDRAMGRRLAETSAIPLMPSMYSNFAGDALKMNGALKRARYIFPRKDPR